MIRADGTTCWTTTRGEPVRGPNGAVVSLRGTVLDITELKQAQATAMENERRLSTLFANLPGMAYRCSSDKDWTMAIVSQGCKAITGYERSDLHQNRTVSYRELVHPEDRDMLRNRCQASLDARMPFDNEYRIIAKSGDVRWVWERAEGVYAADGTLLGIEGFVQDITERKRAEERIRGALSEKEVLLKEIYHRVKNNLQVVSSLLNLQSRRVADAGVKRLLDDSANRVKSMALVHEQLYRAGNLSRIGLSEYLKQLADNLRNVEPAALDARAAEARGGATDPGRGERNSIGAGGQ
ncbi:MAG: PAS domain-containing protein [Comamonadaceae bacterium]|nr:PAS domain-containing protein [Comamonadaceae bacterium]